MSEVDRLGSSEASAMMNTDPNGYFAAGQDRRIGQLKDERDALADALGRAHQQLEGAVDLLRDCVTYPMDSPDNLKARLRARKALEAMGVDLVASGGRYPNPPAPDSQSARGGQ